MNWLERSWYNKGVLSYLLLPLMLVFWLLSTLRLFAFKIGLKQQQSFLAPVIVVGNITVGGTGKTPFVVYLVNLLQNMGYKPGIVSRGYGAKADNNIPFPRLVSAQSDVHISGDEPKLLAMKTSVPVVIDPNRSNAVRFLEQQTDCDIVISDDGLQHYQMSRDMEIVLLDEQRGLGNGWLLPVGPLREPSTRLQSVDLVISNAGTVNNNTNKDYSLSATTPYQLNSPSKKLEAQKVQLISGIGNPQRFYDSITSLGFEVDSVNWLPDHHAFSAADFAHFSNDQIIVMTEKDAVKCIDLVNPEQCKNWYVLPISAIISKPIEQQIINHIQQITKRQ